MAESGGKGLRWSSVVWVLWLLAAFLLAEILPGAIPGHPIPQDFMWPLLTGGVAVLLASLGYALTRPSPRTFADKWAEEFGAYAVIVFIAHFFFPQSREIVREQISAVATVIDQAAPGLGLGKKFEGATRIANLPPNDWDDHVFDTAAGEGATLVSISMAVDEKKTAVLTITLRNDSNALLNGVEARVVAQGDFGMPFSFDVSPALRPQTEREIVAEMPITGDSPSAEALRAWLKTGDFPDVAFQVARTHTSPFDRKATFDQEVAAWLDE